MASVGFLQPQIRAIDTADAVAMFLHQNCDLLGIVGIVPPVDDVTYERQPVFPKLPHLCEVLEAVATGKQLAFVREHKLSADPHRRRADFYVLDLGAGGTHEQSRSLVPKPGVEMERVTWLVWMGPDSANGMCFLA
jgi:hypothetical protein